MQDLTEAYFSIYEDHDDLNEVKGYGGHQEDYVDEGRAYAGGPDLAHMFPLSKEDQESAKNIGAAAKTKAAAIAGESQTKSPSKPPTTKPTLKRRSRGTTNQSGDTWQASTNEQVDFYDLVLDYLLDEGYADTEENAISMMSAMSEDWINSIIG